MRLLLFIAASLVASSAYAEPSVDEKRDAAQLGLTEFCGTVAAAPVIDLEVIEEAFKEAPPKYQQWAAWAAAVAEMRRIKCGDS